MVPLVMSLASLTSRTSMSIIVVGGVASSISSTHWWQRWAVLSFLGFRTMQHEACSNFLAWLGRMSTCGTLDTGNQIVVRKLLWWHTSVAGHVLIVFNFWTVGWFDSALRIVELVGALLFPSSFCNLDVLQAVGVPADLVRAVLLYSNIFANLI